MDEKLLYDTFSAFGVIVTNPKVIHSFCFILVKVTIVFCGVMGFDPSGISFHVPNNFILFYKFIPASAV